MTHSELIKATLQVINGPEDNDIRETLKAMKDLPEPEDDFDSSIRLLLVDMAVEGYLRRNK